MNRWVCVWLFVVSWMCAGLDRGFAEESPRHNLVFCFADDWGRYAGCYREVLGTGTPNDLLQTPNMDRVAANGVLFKHAFVTAPSCTPCRSSLLSGQYFWRTGRGAVLQGAQWDPAIPTFPLLLRESGYHIGKTTKVWSPGNPSDAPYGGQKHAYQKGGNRFNQFSEEVTEMVGQGYELIDAKGELVREVRANFREFLKARPEGQPFCYWFGPTNVHRKWVRGSGAALWGLKPDDLQGKLPPFLPDVPEVREDFADYLGEVMAFDAYIGELLAELKTSGELDRTVFVISGDHGPPGFPQGKCNLYDFGTNVSLIVQGPGIPGGRVVDDFVNLMDLAPTFLEAGGVAIPEVMTGRSVWPTLRSSATGLVDPTRTFVVTGRERHVSIARDDYLPYPQRAIRTAEALYIINFAPERWPLGNDYRLTESSTPTFDDLANETYATFADMDASPTKAWLVINRAHPEWKPYYDRAFAPRPREELYLLKDDPHQMHNVAADPAHQTLRVTLEQQLLAELTRSQDPRLVDNGRYFETPPLAGPVEGVKRPK
jgi:N-sulfoglucosamine sulfohydrolase